MRRFFVAALAVLLAPVLPLLVANPADAASSSMEARLTSFVNSQRSAAGLAPLLINATLITSARSWTDHMIATGTLAENSNLSASVPPDWSAAGENVGYGRAIDDIATAMWNSGPHRANILGNFDALGVGVTRRGDGMLFATIDFVMSRSSGTYSTCAGAHPTSSASSTSASGYRVLVPDGGLSSYGSATDFGSVRGTGVHTWAVMLASTPSSNGYWILDMVGGIFSFGDAHFYGSLPGIGVRDTGVDLASTPNGGGYWILGADGGVFSFGNAHFYGSLPGLHVQNTAIKLLPTPDGGGYWILGADGGVFSFGNAHFYGSLPGLHVHNTGVSMAVTPSGHGYWVLGQDGGVFSFGDAQFHGSAPGMHCPAIGVQLIPTVDGNGYYVLSLDGQVLAFGDAPWFGQPAGPAALTLDLAISR